MLQAQILGQLLLMQSMVIALPDKKSIFSFVCRGLRDLPAVMRVSFADTQQKQDQESTVCIPLISGDTFHGELLFYVDNMAAFTPYVDYLKNFCFMLAVILEERNHRSQNALLQHQLEDRVRERTKELQDQITVRKGIEASLRESEGRFRSLVENLPVKVFIKNRESVYMSCNPSYAAALGITPEEIQGTTDYDYYIRELAEKYRSDDKLVIETGQAKEMEEVFSIDSQQRWVWTIKTPLRNEMHEVTGVLGVFWDITERKRIEEKIVQALGEKETLIRELYHRTKNTMHVISSMLALQAAEYPDNEDLQLVVETAEQRINAISLVHQMLYKTQDLSQISIKAYLHELSALIMSNCTLSNDRIAVELNIDDQYFLLDTAIPFGLIVNELMTNSLKYAFPENRKGTITLSLTQEEPDEILFHYSDNGVGVPREFNFKSQNTLGINLIYNIGEKQLMGTVTMENNNGISCSVKFKKNRYKVRV